MSYYRRGYRFPYGRSRLGYRRGYNRYWRRNWARSRGVYRSQVAGSRNFNVTVPTSSVFQVMVPASSYWSNVVCVNPYRQRDDTGVSFGALTTSTLYRTYCGLYDEVKINSVYLRITLMSNIGTGGVVDAVKVYTMWDRRLFQNELNSANLPSYIAMQNGSGSQCSLVVNNSRAIFSRWNRASDLQERTVYHDCTVGSSSLYGYVDGQWGAGEEVGYCPGCFIALNTNSAPGDGQSYTFTISVDVRWNVTFRNPKFGLSVSSAKSETVSDLREAAVKEVKDDAMSESPIVPVDEKVPDTEVKPVKVGDVWYMQCSDGILRPLEISGKDGSEVLDDDETIIEKKG